MKRCVQVVCCLACLLVTERAAAEISIKLSNQELTTQSDVIVIGRALDSASRWTNGMLMTAVRVQVREALKGAGLTVVDVLLPGGVDLTRRVPCLVHSGFENDGAADFGRHRDAGIVGLYPPDQGRRLKIAADAPRLCGRRGRRWRFVDHAAKNPAEHAPGDPAFDSSHHAALAAHVDVAFRLDPDRDLSGHGK